MKKKVGILTFHFAGNYGAILQAMGTYLFLKDCDVNVEVIDYIPYKVPKIGMLRGYGIKDNVIGFIKKFKTKIQDHKIVYSRHKKLVDFVRNNIKLSENYKNYEELSNNCKRYDAVVVGSDQVWNYYTTNKTFCSEYYLSFYDGEKISYAASCGVNQPAENMDKILTYLKKFNAISVRDEVTKKMLNRLGLDDIEKVSDPTLLVNYDKYAICTKRLSSLPDSYVLVYKFNDIDGFDQIAKKISNATRLPLVVVGSKRIIKADYHFLDCGVDEWLYLIKNAKYVFTHSYHGVLFSIKYNIDFIVYAYAAQGLLNDRIIDLSRRYNFQKHVLFENVSMEKMHYLIDCSVYNDFKKDLLLSDIDNSKKFIEDNII